MNKIELVAKKREFVPIFWEHSNAPELRSLFPFEDSTLEEAYALFEKIASDDKSSFGKSILANGRYIGDVWAYSIDYEEKSAFLSIVIFDNSHWGKGIGSHTIRLFLDEFFEKYPVQLIRAFTFETNTRSIKCLENLDFQVTETFEEDGVRSCLLTLQRPH